MYNGSLVIGMVLLIMSILSAGRYFPTDFVVGLVGMPFCIVGLIGGCCYEERKHEDWLKWHEKGFRDGMKAECNRVERLLDGLEMDIRKMGIDLYDVQELIMKKRKELRSLYEKRKHED